MNKRCRNCLRDLPILEFYPHAKMADGYLNSCKDCVRAASAKFRLNNIETVREYDRERNNLPHRVAARKEYLPIYRANNPEKNNAHRAVSMALDFGIIVRPNSCSKCGEPCVPHGHHPDYNKPLDVVWLCVACHAGEPS